MNIEQHAAGEEPKPFPRCVLLGVACMVTLGKHIQLIDTQKVERIALWQEINR